MKFRSLPPNIDRDDYNSGNHHDRDPYYIDDSDWLIIDKNWWTTQVPQRTKDLLRDRNLEFTIGNVPIPHEDQFDRRLVSVYQAYQEAFEFQEWAKEPNVMIVTAAEKQNLDWDTVKHRIRIENGKKYFVRTGCTSGKNVIPIKPCWTAEEIVDHISNNPEIQMREWNRMDKDSYICLQEWNDSIDFRNEFRLFIFDDRIVALSPQKYWMCHDYTQDELESIEEAVLEYNLEQPFGIGVPFIIDAWVDFETRKLNLIEYNCFGDHSGAGSSLFNWISDHDLLYGKKEKCEFRFISTVNLSN